MTDYTVTVTHITDRANYLHAIITEDGEIVGEVYYTVRPNAMTCDPLGFHRGHWRGVALIEETVLVKRLRRAIKSLYPDLCAVA